MVGLTFLHDGAAHRSTSTAIHMNASDQFAIVGRIRKPHGIRGEVTVEVLTGEPERFFANGRRLLAGTATGEIASHPAARRNSGEPHEPHELRELHELHVGSASPFQGGLVVSFAEIADRSAAEMWRQRYLLVPIQELTPPADDEVFMHDLLGMSVEGEDGSSIGEVTGFYELPQGLTLEVKRGSGDEVLVPYSPRTVREVNIDRRVLVVDTASGLFE
jgi:16S rRNA processing protein RimM